MKRKYIIGLVIAVIIVIGVIVAALIIARQPKYEVMAGELTIDMDYCNSLSIEPGKVKVENLNKGAVIIPLSIVNDTNEKMDYAVSLRYPDFTTEGYAICCLNNEVVVTTDKIDAANLSLQPHSKDTINICVKLAEGLKLDQNYEAWVSIKPVPNGILNTEMCLRILVDANK